MAARVRSAWLIAALLVISLPSLALAQEVNFGVVPAEVHIDNLPPGEITAFNLTVTNNDEITRVFTFSACEPSQEEARELRAGLPDDSWVSFSPPEIAVAPGAQANVTVMIAIPREQKWAGRDWETWLGVAAKSDDLLGVTLYVRLLVSTTGTRLSVGFIAGIAAGSALLGYGSYRYFKRRTRFD